MKQISLLIFGFIISSSLLLGQQMQANNHYFINKYSLSPAYAGITNNVEAFLLYRQNWIGVDGAPEQKGLTGNGPINDNSGFGITLLSEKTGIFRSFSAQLSYAYRLKFGIGQSLSFGLSGGIYDTDIDIGSITAPDDPVVMNNQSVSSTVFDATFGLLYTCNRFNVGAVIPRLIESTIKDDSSTVLYTLKRQFNVHLSYSYLINKDWQLEPVAVVRNNLNSPISYDVGALIKYKQQVWLTGLYRAGGAIGIGIGGAVHDRIVINYGYELADSGIQAEGTGTHEISIGLLIGQNSGHYGSIFRPKSSSSKLPYRNWMN